MENGFVFFDKTFRKDIYQNMVNEQEHQSLMQTLIQMQTAQGINRKEAAAMAGLCIMAVTSCESIRSELTEDTASLVEEILGHAEKSDDAERILHKLYFGLSVYPDFVAANNQMTVDELFWRYYREIKGTKTIETLKSDIRNALVNYRLTPEVIQAMAMKMEGSGDYLATAAALGEGGISFKCIAAMELYLNNRDTMTIHEAANIACAGVEVQAAADAVGRGMLTRDVAKKILIIAGITLAVVGLGIMIYQAGSVAALAEAAAGVVDQYIKIPAVFAEFATHAATGEHVALVSTADSIRKLVYDPLIKAAEHKLELGGIVMALGAAAVGLSKKTADLIGKFRAGFTAEKETAKAGLQQLAVQRQSRETTPAVQTEHQTEQEADLLRQTQPATLGAV